MNAMPFELHIQISVGKATGTPMLEGHDVARLRLEFAADLATPRAVFKGLSQPSCLLNRSTLLLDSRVLCDQQLNERRKQRFTPLAHVVHELEETQVQREFLLGNAPMRAQPTPQERPEPLHGIDMDFTQAVAIV